MIQSGNFPTNKYKDLDLFRCIHGWTFTLRRFCTLIFYPLTLSDNFLSNPIAPRRSVLSPRTSTHCPAGMRIEEHGCFFFLLPPFFLLETAPLFAMGGVWYYSPAPFTLMGMSGNTRDHLWTRAILFF